MKGRNGPETGEKRNGRGSLTRGRNGPETGEKRDVSEVGSGARVGGRIRSGTRIRMSSQLCRLCPEYTLLFQRVRTNDRGWVEFWSLIMAPISKKVNVFHVSTRALLLSLTINIKLFFYFFRSRCLKKWDSS
jgi:hypothetical protein